jgi:cullin 3
LIVNRRAYSLVLHKRGEELYSAVEAAMASEVQALVGSLAAAGPSGQSFLRELLATWRRHTAAVSAIRNIVMYMDRTFVPATGRTPVRELGLGLWRDGVVRSESIRLRLVEEVRLEKGREKEDGAVDVPGAGDLVAGVTEMLTELGADVCHEFMDSLPTVSS